MTSRSKHRTLIALAAVAVFLIAAVSTSAIRSAAPHEAAAPVAAAPVAAAPVPAPLPAPVAPSLLLDSVTSVIELEGDIFDNPAGLPDDWDTINCNGGSALAKTFVADGLGTSIFTQGGSKDPSDVSDWRHTDGSVPDKNEVLNAYAAKYTGPTGDDILVFGADRYGNDGSAFVGFWFFQQNVFAAPDGRFRQGPLNTDALATHEDGDVLVLASYSQGGAIATSQVFQWVAGDPSACTAAGGVLQKGDTLCDITLTAPVGSVFSVSNASAQTIPGSCPAWMHTPKSGPDGTIQVNAFFEGAINLDAFPALTSSCFSSFMVETRSSDEVNAQLKDFALGQLDTCPDISVTKTANDNSICLGETTTYTYTVNNPTSFTLSVTLVDDNATPGDTSDDLDVLAGCITFMGSPSSQMLAPGSHMFQCMKTLSSTGSHTNTVTATASFGQFSSMATDDETVVVNPNPDLSINAVACDLDGAITLEVTDANMTGATYSWTRNGMAFAGNVSSINVTLPGSYQVTATTADGCVDTATRVVGLCTDMGNNP